MTRSYPPPEWRYRTERRKSSPLVDLFIVAFMVAVLAGVVHLFSGCSSLSAQRAACSAVGVTLTAASERIVDAMADDYVATEDDAAVDERWQAPLAAYETAAVAQNAWADALDNGDEFPAEDVRGVYCTARAALVEVVAMPDWPMGGCQ